MPISGLDSYLAASRLLQTAPLTALRETRLGIDLSLYLRLLLSSPRTAEPLTAALSGSPLALSSHIEADLRALEQAQIKPVFVLHGLPPTGTGPKRQQANANAAGQKSSNGQQQPQQQQKQTYVPPPAVGAGIDDPVAAAEQRRLAWEAYERDETELTNSHLAKSGSIKESDLIRAVFRAFRHRNIEFLVAPYGAHGQLVSLERHSKSYVHAIYGPSSLLLFDRVERLVLSLDLQDLHKGTGPGSFTFVSKPALLQSLGCTEEEFLDLGLLCGFEHCPTFPPFLDGTFPGVVIPGESSAATGSILTGGSGPTPNIRAALEVLKSYRSGYTLCTSFEKHPACQKIGYTDLFCKARCMIKFALVASAEEGRVLPLPLATPPPPIPAAGGQPGAPPSQGGAVVAPGINGASPAVPSFAPNGVLAPILTAADVPSDLHEIFCHRLPDEVFLHLSRGLIGPNIVSALASQHIHEPAPLSPDTTDEYRRFCREQLTELPQSPRCVSMALMANALHQFWTSRKVVATYWWDTTREHPVPYDSIPTLKVAQRVNNWNVGVAFIEDELRRQNSSTIDIALCLGSTRSASLAARTKTARPKPAPPGVTNGNGASNALAAQPVLEKKDEVVANVIWRFLEIRGFLNHDHLHTGFARALHLGLEGARLNDKLQEPLYIALELMRAGALHGNAFSGRLLSGGPAWGDTSAEGQEGQDARDARKHLLLIMRCLSLLPMSFRPSAWSAPLSRELLLFASFTKSMSRSLRSLIECIASNLLLRGDARRARDDYLDISLSLPFQSDANTGMGILVKCYLEALLTFNNGPVLPGKENEEDVKEAVEQVLGIIEGPFENVKDIRNELRRGFRFWDALIKTTQTLKTEDLIAAELVSQFEAADKWLKPMTHF
ncbi:PIN domain-like protein [Ceraceosorus guamensis]|uniref:PIN domain-like protein n=1 Tax=Ceraceosorus guamensis TaxID=1522189 RepID=A0A316VTD5_9BASI|nr:PIN domain-like protein [Ceraceosorus guamensis]PWN39683.1 PIN domain-like protein [Ceraceosorus guamensis]